MFFLWTEKRAGSVSTLDKTLLTYDDSIISGFFCVSFSVVSEVWNSDLSRCCVNLQFLSAWLTPLPTVGGAPCRGVLLATLSVLMERQLPVTIWFVTAPIWLPLLNTSCATGFRMLAARESAGRLAKAGLAAPAPRVSGSAGLDVAWERACLTSSQVMPGPHWENRFSTWPEPVGPWRSLFPTVPPTPHTASHKATDNKDVVCWLGHESSHLCDLWRVFGFWL